VQVKASRGKPEQARAIRCRSEQAGQVRAGAGAVEPKLG
jgi:hypothetical protein